MFGLQRTCTNLVRRLLMDNFDTLTCERGLEWKHGPVKSTDRHIDGRRMRLVVCVRDPLVWLPACRRYFNGHKGSDNTVCRHFRRRWSLADFCRRRHYRWASPVDRWNEMNRHWLDVLKANPELGVVVRSEDLMSPEGQTADIRRIQEALSLAPTREFQPIVNRVDNLCQVRRQRMDFGYYNHRAYLDDYPPKLLAWVVDRLDKSLMAELGYATEVEVRHETEAVV
jgi:hypothetical protein